MCSAPSRQDGASSVSILIAVFRAVAHIGNQEKVKLRGKLKLTDQHTLILQPFYLFSFLFYFSLL